MGLPTESQKAAADAAKRPPNISDKATPEQILNRIREWIISEPVTAESKFGDGYRQGLRDVRSLIATHVHSDRFEPQATGDSRLTVQQDDALWDAAIPAGGGTPPTNVEVHKRVCSVVADMLAEQRAALTIGGVEICELPHETIAEEDKCESRREELTELRDAVLRMFQLADHWATSDDTATRTGAKYILQNLPPVRPMSAKPPLSDRQLTEQMLADQYAEDIESAVSLNVPMICTREDALKIRDAVLSVRDRWSEKLRQRLSLADMFRDDNNKETEELKRQVFNLTTEVARATKFRAQVGEYLIESVIGNDFR
jgi:hypothetical protein